MLDSLRKRRTVKMIGDPAAPEPGGNISRERIDKLLAAAGNAPFHQPCDRIHQNSLTSPVPWRCYKLDSVGCRKLMSALIASGDPTKVPNMLAAAEALLQVTWLPDPDTISPDQTEDSITVFAGTIRNMEHIAAASSFVQSVLLAVDDEGLGSYWSSGGILRRGEVFGRLGIPEDEILLGSIFLFPSEPTNSETKPGKLSQMRGTVEDWSRWTL
ncbi:MAG: nitroreductase family protein [Pseudomonadota bacterium]